MSVVFNGYQCKSSELANRSKYFESWTEHGVKPEIEINMKLRTDVAGYARR